MSIQYTEVNQDALNINHHVTGHVYLFANIDGKVCVLLGHNKDHDNVASFGGFSDGNETVRETILREFQEETLGALMSLELLSSFLDKGRIITRQSQKGHHFTVFCQIGPFKMDGVNEKFKIALQNPDLKEDERENDYLVALGLEKIQEAVKNSPNEKEVYVDGFHIRDINVPVYRWIFSN